MSEDSACRLYLITPPRINLAAFSDLLKSALDAGDVACLQLRLKDVDDDTIRRSIDSLMPIAVERDVAFILNDRADLAAEMDCDGVHVGREDSTYKDARTLLGKDAIVGTTCHASRHLAMTDAEAGADYVAFGAFFPTDTKETTHKADVGLLDWWSQIMEVPCVAIGGISSENCRPLVEAGADFLAVIGAVWNHPNGPAAGVKAMNDAINAT